MIRNPAVLAACLLSLTAAVAAPSIEIGLAARSLAPGEPVRVVARSPLPLTSLGGTLGARSIRLVPCPGSADGRCWTGWSMIGLDDAAGPIPLELSGTTADGDAVDGSRTVTVESRQFPEERLTVSTKYVAPPPEVEERLERERATLARIYEGLDRPALPSVPFVRPVPGEPTSTFGKRRFFNDEPRSPHPGLDLRAATGTPVRAAGPGRVVLASDLYYSGNTVIVDHGGRLFTLYAHLSRIDVDEGDEVQSGRQLGLSGATGRVTGPHLHWGAKIGDEPFDPTALLDPALFASTDQASGTPATR